MNGLKLGKLPAAPEHVGLRLNKYLDFSALPTPPTTYGYNGVAPNGWGMLGNDEWGDCAIAGPAHETMILTGAGQHGSTTTPFTTAGVLSDYSAITGFNANAGPPGDNPTDNGSVVADVVKYRQATGMIDAHGARHKIGAALRINHTNLIEVAQALYIFETIGIGFEVPKSAMSQFDAHEPWTVVNNSPIEGGHYVCLVARKALNMYQCVTWGSLQLLTTGFMNKYVDEAWCYVSTDALEGTADTPRGLDMATLQADLAEMD